MGIIATSDADADGPQKINKLLSAIPELNLADYIVVEKTLRDRGGCSDVYKGYCKRHMKDVAVKKITNVDVAHEKTVDLKIFVQRLYREIKIWVGVEHTNVLPFLGYFVDEHGSFNLVSEWMIHGNLHAYYVLSNPNHLERGEPTLLMVHKPVYSSLHA